MEDQDFRIFCNMLDGLAFLPIADLPEGIAYIRSVITEEPAETEELVDYFETTYVTGTYRPVQRNGEQRLTMRRVPSMFPPSIWSVHSATVDSDPRTNNVGEGWNNKFFTLVGMVSTRTHQQLQQLYSKTPLAPNQQRESTRSKCCYRNDYRTSVMTASLVERQ